VDVIIDCSCFSLALDSFAMLGYSASGFMWASVFVSGGISRSSSCLIDRVDSFWDSFRVAASLSVLICVFTVFDSFRFC